MSGTEPTEGKEKTFIFRNAPADCKSNRTISK